MTNKQTDWKELCVQLYAALEAHSTTWDDEVLLDRVGTALRRAQPELDGSADDELPPKIGHILKLAAIIREVDGNHSLGAAALAEAILSHRHSRWVPVKDSMSQAQ